MVIIEKLREAKIEIATDTGDPSVVCYECPIHANGIGVCHEPGIKCEYLIPTESLSMVTCNTP